MGGPMKAGSIQAIDIHVIITARSRPSNNRATSTITVRFMVPPPRPWMKRPNSRIGMLGADPATTSPRANTMKPTTIGNRGPTLSLARPATTMATICEITNAVKAQA